MMVMVEHWVNKKLRSRGLDRHVIANIWSYVLPAVTISVPELPDDVYWHHREPRRLAAICSSCMFPHPACEYCYSADDVHDDDCLLIK